MHVTEYGVILLQIFQKKVEITTLKNSMELIIILLTLLSLFIFFYQIDKTSLNEVYLKSLLSLSGILVLITEFLNIFQGIHYWGLLLSWIVVFTIISTFVYLKSPHFFSSIQELISRVATRLTVSFQSQKILTVSLFILVVIVGIQGLLYPPNNWDSLTYHLSRVAHWASQSSINHYPTNVSRQLYQPPFAEFSILHLAILNGNDYFANVVQFLCWLSLVPVVSLLASLLSINHTNSIILAALVLSLPEGILQASSTQNDLVIGVFMLTSIYFTYKTIRLNKPWQSSFFTGLSIGLAMLTKGTAYFFLLPIILMFIWAGIKKLMTKEPKFILYGLIVAIIAISINAGHYTRNFQLMKNPLGTDSKLFANETINANITILSMAKNIGLHIGPYPLNRWYDNALLKLHSILNTPINSPITNFQNIPYSGAVSIPNHEDNAPNFIHFYLIVLSFILGLIALLRKQTNLKSSMGLLFILVTQFVVFCTYLKWQPWHTRLHLPLFFLAIPLILFFLSKSQFFKNQLPKLLIMMVWLGIGIACINYSRPLWSNPKTAAIKPMDKRYKKYFANNLAVQPEYESIDSIIQVNQYKEFGIVLIGDTWEYPLIYQNFSTKRKAMHLKIDNASSTLQPKNIKPTCVVSTQSNDSVFLYQDIKYRNITPHHQYIWMFQAQ